MRSVFSYNGGQLQHLQKNHRFCVSALEDKRIAIEHNSAFDDNVQ